MSAKPGSGKLVIGNHIRQKRGFDMSMFWAGHIIHAAAEAAERNAAIGPSRSPSQSSDIQYLKKEVGRLEIICQALWELLKDQLSVTDEQLMGYIAELDLADGRADGQVSSKGPIACPKCGKANSRRHEYCMYCGEAVRTTPFG